MPDRGSYRGPGPNSPFCSTCPRQGRSSARWSRRAMIPSPLLRRAVVAALAALAITWPGMVSAWAQAQPREGFARTSPSGSYLAARHAGDQRDVAAAASYYRAALRGDPRNNELLGRTFLAVLANGEVEDAVKLAERVLLVYKTDPTGLRVVQSYGSFLSRQANISDALKVFASFEETLPRHPLIVEALNELKAGKKLPLLVDTPQAGAAEALYGLGSALGRRGGEDLALIYLQLALYLAPSHQMAMVSLADLYEALKKPELAIKVYDRIPASSPMYRNAAIQRALNLDSLERS